MDFTTLTETDLLCYLQRNILKSACHHRHHLFAILFDFAWTLTLSYSAESSNSYSNVISTIDYHQHLLGGPGINVGFRQLLVRC